MIAGTLTIGGVEYVVVPRSEYEARMPRLPAKDQRGERPAKEAIQAVMARSLIRRRTEAGLGRSSWQRWPGCGRRRSAGLSRGDIGRSGRRWSAWSGRWRSVGYSLPCSDARETIEPARPWSACSM